MGGRGGLLHPNKKKIVYLHVLKVSASNGTKKKMVLFWPKVVVGPRPRLGYSFFFHLVLLFFSHHLPLYRSEIDRISSKTKNTDQILKTRSHFYSWFLTKQPVSYSLVQLSFIPISMEWNERLVYCFNQELKPESG